MACVLSIGLIGGAFAYFTDVEKSTGNVMGAGTLDMQIADNNEGYTNAGVHASFSSPPELAPGDQYTTNWVYLKNAGTIPIHWVFARFTNLVESNGTNTDAELAVSPNVKDISNYLIMKSVDESYDGGVTWVHTDFDATTANVFLNYWISRGATTLTPDDSISLGDLVVASNYGSGDMKTALLLFNAPPGNFPNGGVGAVRFTFELSTGTTNVYQGDTASFDVFFIAVQNTTPDYPNDWLAENLTEPID